MSVEEQNDLVKGMKKTRNTIESILSNSTRLSSMPAAERLDHEWNLWLINGILIHDHPI